MRCFYGWHQRQNFWSLGLQIAWNCIPDTLSDFRSIACTSFVCSGSNFSWNFRVSWGSFMRLSFITQFKIEFLLSFTGCRKVLGKMPGMQILVVLFHNVCGPGHYRELSPRVPGENIHIQTSLLPCYLKLYTPPYLWPQRLVIVFTHKGLKKEREQKKSLRCETHPTC